jgi:hypothetical protein
MPRAPRMPRTTPRSIAHRRLAAQRITRPVRTPAEAVAWFGAVQAQDYLAARWAVGLRTGATPDTVEQAIAEGTIVRTHVFRGTLQYVARDDLRWMLALVGGRLLTGAAARHRQLGLDEPTLCRAEQALRTATQGTQLTRADVVAVLERAGIAAGGQRLIHIVARAELRGVICSGARRGKQATFASFDERVPAAAARSRDEALAELARRYFRSHAPATARDFQWWSGLSAKDVREALAAIDGELASEELDGVVYRSVRASGRPGGSAAGAYLLPAFDEYLVGYQDRRDVLRADHVRAINAGGGFLAPCVVVDGRVIGSWRRRLVRAGVAVEREPFGRWDRGTRAQVDEAVERYAAFLGLPLA